MVARIHYEIPEDLHRRAKAAAAMQGISLKQFVIDALESATQATARDRKRAARRDEGGSGTGA